MMMIISVILVYLVHGRTLDDHVLILRSLSTGSNDLPVRLSAHATTHWLLGRSFNTSGGMTALAHLSVSSS